MKNILAIAALILLLTHPSAALEGAGRGLLLWSRTVLPSLLPFMICSNVIVSIGALPLVMTPFRPVLSRLFRLSENGGYVLVSGLLCGYPMGAKTCSEFLSQNRLSVGEARYLLAISNHASPMFLLGYVASCLCPQVPLWTVLVSLYLPVLPLSFLARRLYLTGRTRPRAGYPEAILPSAAGLASDPATGPRAASASGPAAEPHISSASGPAADPHMNSASGSAAGSAARDFDDIMMSSIEVMVRIGGYLMLFSILAVFIGRLPGLSAPLKALCVGIAEITTGIRSISQTMTGAAQGLAITAVTAFGGLSGIFQTKSVLKTGAKNAGLSIRHYILWKLLHTAVSCLIFILLALALPPVLPAVPAS